MESLEKHQAHVRYTAAEYDRYTAQYVKAFDDSLTARIVREVELRRSDAVLLDVGTGTARLLIGLAAVPQLAGVRLVGTDLFPDMIEQARIAAADAGVAGRLELIVCDVHAMELPDAYADIIVSRSTLHHWSAPAVALAEMYRLLKPGGVAIVHDIRRDPEPAAIAEFDRLRALAGLPPSFLDEKFTAAEVEAFLREAGIAEQGSVYAPATGIGAVGMEVRIDKAA